MLLLLSLLKVALLTKEDSVFIIYMLKYAYCRHFKIQKYLKSKTCPPGGWLNELIPTSAEDVCLLIQVDALN